MKKKVRIHSIRHSAAMVFILFLSVHCMSGRQNAITEGFSVPERKYPVYIISNNFHTGITLELTGPAGRILKFADFFKGRKYVDIGWGDEVIYQAPDIRPCSAVRAMLIPSSSVVRTECFDSDIINVMSWSQSSIDIEMDERQLALLCEFINDSLTRDARGRLVAASFHGRDVIFFKSPRRYHMFNTCNTWVAEALQRSGLDISPFFVITAGTLFRRLEKLRKAR